MTNKSGLRAVLALTLVGSFAAQSALACKAPVAPASLPDGRSATLQQMQAAKVEVERYVERVAAYFRCENDALKLQEVSEGERAVLTRFNSAVRTFQRASMVAAR